MTYKNAFNKFIESINTIIETTDLDLEDELEVCNEMIDLMTRSEELRKHEKAIKKRRIKSLILA